MRKLGVDMSDEKPNPLADAVKGLGLLFRAAKTTVEKLPKKDLEEMLVTSAREVGRAFENVATTVEREVFGHRAGSKPGERERDRAKGPEKPSPDPGAPGEDDPKPPNEPR
jgi:hypothetical protein